MLRFLFVLALALVAISAARAADVVPPAEPQLLTAQKAGSDLLLSWQAVVDDVTSAAETIQEYRVYNASSADFVPDASSLIGQPTTNTFSHAGAGYYLVSAVDSNAIESNRRAAKVGAAPIGSASYTGGNGSITWTPAMGAVAGYRVFWGTSSLAYSSSFDVEATATTANIGALAPGSTYYVTVLAIDGEGNLSPFVGEASIVACPGTSVTLKPNSHVTLPNSDGGFTNFPNGGPPTYAWDSDPNTKADCIYNGLWWAVCGGNFAFPSVSTTSGHIEVTISAVPHCAPGPPKAEASYSTNGGQTWTEFLAAVFPVENEPATFSSATLQNVQTGQLLIQVRGETAFLCDEGQALLHDVSFLGCLAP
jgi:hypothetical protein